MMNKINAHVLGPFSGTPLLRASKFPFNYTYRIANLSIQNFMTKYTWM